MAQAVKTGAWSPDEDDLLYKYQQKHGNKWSVVALYIPGRTGQQCAQRWRHKVNPNIKKDKWTPEEDSQLVELVTKFGNRWAEIARHMDGRTDQQCMGRWTRHLDPSISRDAWAPEEDEKLLALHASWGTAWSRISKQLDGRTAQQCRARFFQLKSTDDARDRKRTSDLSAEERHLIKARQEKNRKSGASTDAQADDVAAQRPRKRQRASNANERSSLDPVVLAADGKMVSPEVAQVGSGVVLTPGTLQTKFADSPPGDNVATLPGSRRGKGQRRRVPSGGADDTPLLPLSQRGGDGKPARRPSAARRPSDAKTPPANGAMAPPPRGHTAAKTAVPRTAAKRETPAPPPSAGKRLGRTPRNGALPSPGLFSPGTRAALDTAAGDPHPLSMGVGVMDVPGLTPICGSLRSPGNLDATPDVTDWRRDSLGGAAGQARARDAALFDPIAAERQLLGLRTSTRKAARVSRVALGSGQVHRQPSFASPVRSEAPGSAAALMPEGAGGRGESFEGDMVKGLGGGFNVASVTSPPLPAHLSARLGGAFGSPGPLLGELEHSMGNGNSPGVVLAGQGGSHANGGTPGRSARAGPSSGGAPLHTPIKRRTPRKPLLPLQSPQGR
ncbi:unnamed protein product [Pedinophyceae sp. YPF-701]|nr:unnamed protein product [Pedinophyceae sp. YPF-701]